MQFNSNYMIGTTCAFFVFAKARMTMTNQGMLVQNRTVLHSPVTTDRDHALLPASVLFFTYRYWSALVMHARIVRHCDGVFCPRSGEDVE